MARQPSWPFRQDDELWKDELMWDRAQVIEGHMRGNAATRKAANDLLRKFKAGNTIGNEGCLLTCLSMVLKLLDTPKRRNNWTPATLNAEAQARLYYTAAGISMTPLYADLVSEVSGGEVQLAAKEEYLSGEAGWPPTFVSTCWLAKGYRALSAARRRDFIVMLKIGTYDDTVASHYVLLHPDRPGKFGDDDPEILDLAMPERRDGTWRLSDSSRQICGDRAIKAEWTAGRIGPLQLCGVWLFARWRSGSARMLMEPLVIALAKEFGQ